LRRFIPTLVLLFVLLVAGGALIFTQGTGGSGAASGSSVAPTILGSLAALAGLIAVGYLVAQVFSLVGRLFGRAPDVQLEAPKAAAKPVSVFLYDRQSLTVFSVATVVLVLGFLITRALSANVPAGYPLDRMPDFSGVLFSVPMGTDSIEILQWQALAALVAVSILGVVVVAIVLATLAQGGEAATRKLEAAAAAAAGGAAKPVAGAKPAPAAKADLPVPFLYDNRQRIFFYVIVGIVVLAFLLVRWQATGTPLAYPFDGTVKLDTEVLVLPGIDLEGWPEGVPGPGQPLLVWQGLVALAGSIVGVLVVGFLLARGITALDGGIRAAEKATGQWPAPQVAKLEASLQAGAGQPRRLDGLDQVIIVLLGAIAVLALIWIVPTIGNMFAVDASVEQTRVASFWTPTPPPGPTATPGPSPDEAIAQLPAGDAANGEALVAAQGCIACHIANPDTPDAVLAGPSWQVAGSKDGKGIAAHAAERFSSGEYTGTATSAEAYLYESIVNPGAFVVPTYVAGVMPGTYGGTLSQQDLADIIAYLKTVQ